MVLWNLHCIFAGKFTNIILNMQEKSEELTRMGLRSYFGSLSYKDRIRLKRYVTLKFELSYYTVDAKFRDYDKFSAAELLAMQPIIQEELWKQ